MLAETHLEEEVQESDVGMLHRRWEARLLGCRDQICLPTMGLRSCGGEVLLGGR